VVVFAYKNKGKVYLYALYFLIVGLLAFGIHLWLLARYERHQKERESALQSPAQPVVREPV
jgi:replication initiation and membrane attachment protein DnaB